MSHLALPDDLPGSADSSDKGSDHEDHKFTERIGVAQSIRRKSSLIQQHENVVYRVCRVHITHFELLQRVSASGGHVTLGVRVRGQKMKHMLRSQPIKLPTKKDQPLKLPVDLVFQCDYAHKLKGKPSVLQFLLQKPHKLRLSQHKTLAEAQIPLDLIMQRPLHDSVPLAEPVSKLDKFASRGTDKSADRVVARIDVQVSSSNISAVKPSTELFANWGQGPVSSQLLVRDEWEDYESGTSGDEHHATLSGSDDGGDGHGGTRAKFKRKTEKIIASLKDRGREFLQRFRDRTHSTADKDSKLYVAHGSDEWAQAHIRAVLEATWAGTPLTDGSDHDEEKHADSSDATIDSQVAAYFPAKSPKSQPAAPRAIVLIDARCRGGRRLLRWCRRKPSTRGVLSHVVALHGKEDCARAFRQLIAKFRQLLMQNMTLHTAEANIVVAGLDRTVSWLLEPYVQLLSRERRGWQKLKFFIIPLSSDRGQNVVASWIAAQDPLYRRLFFCSEWTTAFDSPRRGGPSKPSSAGRDRAMWIEPVGQLVEESIERYVNNATQELAVPIAETVIDQVTEQSDSSTGKSAADQPSSGKASSGQRSVTIPFLRGVEILPRGDTKGQQDVDDSADMLAPSSGGMPKKGQTSASAGTSPMYGSMPGPSGDAPQLQLGPRRASTLMSSSKELASLWSKFREKESSKAPTFTLTVDYWVAREKKSKKHSLKCQDFHRLSVVRLLHPFAMPPQVPEVSRLDNLLAELPGSGDASPASSSPRGTHPGPRGSSVTGPQSSTVSGNVDAAAGSLSRRLQQRFDFKFLKRPSRTSAEISTPSTMYLRALTRKQYAKQLEHHRHSKGSASSHVDRVHSASAAGSSSSAGNESGAQDRSGRKAAPSGADDAIEPAGSSATAHTASPRFLPDVEPVCVTKVICSSEEKQLFSVCIDGVMWHRVNLVSVSPHWSSRVKSLPVATVGHSLSTSYAAAMSGNFEDLSDDSADDEQQ